MVSIVLQPIVSYEPKVGIKFAFDQQELGFPQ